MEVVGASGLFGVGLEGPVFVAVVVADCSVEVRRRSSQTIAGHLPGCRRLPFGIVDSIVLKACHVGVVGPVGVAWLIFVWVVVAGACIVLLVGLWAGPRRVPCLDRCFGLVGLTVLGWCRGFGCVGWSTPGGCCRCAWCGADKEE